MGAQQSHLLYQIPSPATYDRNLDDLIWVKEGGMEIPAIHRQWQDDEGNLAVFTVLYAGSHYHDLGMCYQWLKTLQLTLRVNIIAFDYPGYGLHAGETSEEQMYNCAFNVFSYAKNSLNIPVERLIVMGKSLGTAAAIHLAHEIELEAKNSSSENLAGLTLITPFISLSHIVGSKLKYTKADLFDSSKKFEKITVPVLTAHGESDTVIDIKHARKTVSKFPNIWKSLELADCGHHDIDFSDDLMDELIVFVDHIGESVPEYKPRVVKQLVIPSQYRREQTVDNWLESINLGKYAQQFLINGYFSMDVVRTLDSIDLQGMDINDENDREKIMNSVANLVSGGDGTCSKEENKKTSETKEIKENKESVALKRVSYGPMEVNPVQFNEVLEHYKCAPSNSDASIPEEWNEFLAFASSVSIPYWEDEKDESLSRGFFGEVLKSYWNGRPVIKKKLQYKKNQFRKFCREAVLLCQLKHPNIVEVIGACMEKNVCPCLITEYIKGGNLTDFLAQPKEDITDKQRIDIAYGISYGIQFLHGCIPPITHRDLTPNNIFLEEGVAKLADFGMGRPPSFLYMAPELFSKHPAGLPGDIYSLGLILYYIVTGTAPFKGLGSAEAAAKAAKLNIRPSFPDSVSPSWKTLISSCWHKNPLNRPTIDQVIESLNKLENGEESSPVADDSARDVRPISLIESPDAALGEKEEKDQNEFIVANLPSKSIYSGGGLLSYQLGMLVNDEKYSDFTVRVGEAKFAVHRAILATRSENFAAQIEQAGDTREICISENIASSKSVWNLLKFLYSGFLDLHGENVLDVMNAANNLNIVQAVDLCREYLGEHGVPINLKESSDGSRSSNANTEKIRDVKESLVAAETSIQNVENVLEVLNRKLESVTARMNALPTL